MSDAEVQQDAQPRAAGRRWLVTGAGGQVGRSALAAISESGGVAVGRGHEELDISDPVAIARALDRIQPDVVLNCAAFTGVDLCEERLEEAARHNAKGPALLAAACSGSALLVHLSTDYIFGGDMNRPIAEDAEPCPLSRYGCSKLEGERAVRREGGDHLVVRSQWVFGPGPSFVRTILAAARRGDPLRVVEDQIGRPTGAIELTRAIVEAVGLSARGTLHLACEGVASWYDLALATVTEGARRGLNPCVAVQPVPTSEMPRPAQRPAYSVLSLERARRLGVQLPHWREALRDHLAAEAEQRDA